MSNSTHHHTVRIVGGLWKRSKLTVIDAPDLRPTPDRVRVTLFNWLGQDLTGWQCADVFAGTGVLGFEAASRGAHAVIMSETNPVLVQQLQSTQRRLQASTVRIVHGDGIATLQRWHPHSLNLVLLDPPFSSGLFEAALVAATQALSPSGYIYLESPAPRLESLTPGLVPHRYLKAGACHAHLLKKLPTTSR